MPDSIAPRLILETLLPPLRLAAAYAREIQSRIVALPPKGNPEELFSSALSDADLSIQTLVEVSLLGAFPTIRFHGEEYEQSYNTKYFRATDLGPQGDYMVALDPIDGTRLYLDGHANYQIILSVLNVDEFEAVLAINPALNSYYYAFRDQGTFYGALSDDLDACQRLQLANPKNTVLLGSRMGAIAKQIRQRYEVIHTATAYSKTIQMPNFNGFLSGDVIGAVLSKGKFIDGAALAFLAQEAGCIVTTLEGSPPPPLHTCEDYQRPGLIVASSTQVHQHLLEAVEKSGIVRRMRG